MKKLFAALILVFSYSTFAKTTIYSCTALCYTEIVITGSIKPVSAIATNRENVLEKLDEKCNVSVSNRNGFIKSIDMNAIDIIDHRAGLTTRPEIEKISESSKDLNFNSICDQLTLDFRSN